WTLPTNMGEGFVILAAIAIGAALPILPVQILWINMTTAVLLGLMLVFEPKEAGTMKKPPRDPKIPIITGELLRRLFIVSLLMLAGAFGMFKFAVLGGTDVAEARTIAVNVFVIVEMFYLFNCRSLTGTMFRVGFFSNPWVLYGSAGMVALQIFFTYSPVMNRLFGSAPIGLGSWLAIFGFGLAAYLLVEGDKALIRRSGKRRRRKAETNPA
nr:cation transporting ATPase C-terminal domain-containing protein [bacterium]